MQDELNLIAIVIFIIVIIVVIVSVRNGLKKSQSQSIISHEDAKQLVPVQTISQEYHYERRDLIMTRAETEFFKMLNEAFGENYFIFPQVHLTSILEHRIHGQDYWKAFLHIRQKSVDYVICDKQSVRPLVAIELDDWSHKLDKRKTRDAEVERIFRDANFPLLRFGHNGPYTSQSIAQLIADAGVLSITN